LLISVFLLLSLHIVGFMSNEGGQRSYGIIKVPFLLKKLRSLNLISVYNLFSHRCAFYNMVSKSFAAVSFLLTLIPTSLFLSVITAGPAQAETGKGEDVFKVIMTIFGVDKSKGDMVAIVTVNNGEASRVKFLDAEAPYVVSIANPSTPGAEGGYIEYVATFPNITVNAGSEYEACVLPLRNLDPGSMICTTGHNSPAARPEFVDMSLNATN
jgi:hypothetical protein